MYLFILYLFKYVELIGFLSFLYFFNLVNCVGLVRFWYCGVDICWIKVLVFFFFELFKDDKLNLFFELDLVDIIL